VFENRMLRRISGPKRDEVTGGWRTLHNEERRNLYSSPSINGIIKPRMMRWAGYVTRTGDKKNAHRILVGRPEEKNPLERPRRRRKEIKIDFGEVGCGDTYLIHLAQDRDKWKAVVNIVMNLRVQQNAGNFLSS
jgi:hypothetical protein